MTLGEKIRQTRLHRGLSQENLADMLGISTSAFGDIERNKTELSISRAREIANQLGISFLELLGLEIQAPDHQVELLQMENEKLKLEVEKLALEAIYWREKAERQSNEHRLNNERILAEVVSIVGNKQRKQIGF